MENSSFIKQAKSDIFKELYTIIDFYISKGAKPIALKKYYQKNKRFSDLLEDIKNKGINLIKDEKEYEKLVKIVLNDILDDLIAKEKDEEYKIKTKMKHIKEFKKYTGEEIMICPECDGSGYNSKNRMLNYKMTSSSGKCKMCNGSGDIKPQKSKKINEDFQNWVLAFGAGFFFYKFLSGLFKDIKMKKKTKMYLSMTTKEREDYKNKINSNIESVNFKILNEFIMQYLQKDGKINFTEDYVNYIFEVGDLTIKINKFEKTIRWNRIEFGGIFSKYIINKEQFDTPIKISQENIDSLIQGIKEDQENN